MTPIDGLRRRGAAAGGVVDSPDFAPSSSYPWVYLGSLARFEWSREVYAVWTRARVVGLRSGDDVLLLKLSRRDYVQRLRRRKLKLLLCLRHPTHSTLVLDPLLDQSSLSQAANINETTFSFARNGAGMH
jgi:hypothetical protein